MKRINPTQKQARKARQDMIKGYMNQYIAATRTDEQQIQMSNKSIAKIIDAVVRTKDYNLSRLSIVIEQVKGNDKENNSEGESVGEYETIEPIIGLLPFSGTEIISRVKAPLRYSYDIVVRTFNYPIMISEDEWKKFQENRNAQLAKTESNGEKTVRSEEVK